MLVGLVQLDGHQLVSGGADMDLRVRGAGRDGVERRRAATRGAADCGACLPTAQIWDLRSGQCTAVLSGHSSAVTGAVVDNDRIMR
jgi:hypothetical protein